MINVFRMELYRVFRSMSTWILLLVYFCLYLFAGGMVGMLTGNSEIVTSFQSELASVSGTQAMQGGVSVYVDESQMDAMQSAFGEITDYAEMFNMCMMGNMVVLITAIFIGIHGTGHVVTGFQKNLSGSTKKWHFVVSNLLILLLFNAVLILLGALALRIVMFVTHTGVTLNDVSGLLGYCGVYLLLATAYGMFGGVIADFTRSRVAAIAVPVVYCTAASSLVYMLLNYIAKLGLGIADFESERYLPYGALCNLMLNDPMEYHVRAAVSSVVFILLCICISVIVKRKQDVK